MSVVPLDQAQQKTSSRTSHCSRCKDDLPAGTPFWLAGTRRLCPDCFEVLKKEEAARKARKAAREAKRAAKVAEERIPGPAWLEDGKFACPACRKRDKIEIYDYDLAKDRSKGAFLFFWKCKRCEIKFRVQKDI